MKPQVRTLCSVVSVTLFAFVLQGYHPGAEDDAIYLSAIKRRLQPSLYPVNAPFITLQLQASVFDKFVAAFIHTTHLPVAYACLALQLGFLALLFAACWQIVAFCFESWRARFAGILSIACILTISVAGTAIYLADEHLHPRLIATDGILFAVAALQRRRYRTATLLLLCAILFHPIMGAFGLSFCVLFLLVRQCTPSAQPMPSPMASSRFVALPGSWLFTPASPAWRTALAQHSYYMLGRWQWYEWLGAVAPPFLLFVLARLGRARSNPAFYQLAATATLFSIVQLAIALAMVGPPRFLRLWPLQPMRYLHLTFLFMALLAGSALGQYFLRAHVARWLLVFLPLAAANGAAQRMRYPATTNLELPWAAPANPWLQAFAWVKRNTPENAVFALDPHYLSQPGEDNHSFRALAERSSLADDQKDAAVVTQVPQLAATWLDQHNHQLGWTTWTTQQFLRLAQTTPARWALVDPRQAPGLHCPFHNQSVAVCHLD
ncbi:DUF6798 domain-containing protein [Acidipila sp. EB88]|uniref:DUF6798 domain-containing protein n=1 Tax=Acidipila sp. EB88 TaxID=2305226 RepID=UPI000F5E3B5D|nr:DUF6798 domain-containing protein [Acidipila sp. EB88]